MTNPEEFKIKKGILTLTNILVLFKQFSMPLFQFPYVCQLAISFVRQYDAFEP